jgi:hypothetical protein
MLVFQINFLCDSVEVSRRITRELGGEISQFSSNPLKCGVGEVLSKKTSPGPEHHYQTIANQLVFFACGFRIRAEPIQEPFEIGYIDPAVVDVWTG